MGNLIQVGKTGLSSKQDIVNAIKSLFNAVKDLREHGGYNPPEGGIPITDLSQDLQDWKNAIDFLISGGEPPTEAIDTFNEIVEFLNSIEDTTLSNIIANFVQSDTVKHIVVCTQEEYDAIIPKESNTEYNIIEPSV